MATLLHLAVHKEEPLLDLRQQHVRMVHGVIGLNIVKVGEIRHYIILVVVLMYAALQK